MVTDVGSRLDFATINGVGFVGIGSLAAWLRKEALSQQPPLSTLLAEEATMLEDAYERTRAKPC